MINKTECVISTGTYVNNLEELRAQLSLRTAEEAAKCGYRLVVVDGSPVEEFRRELSARGAMVYTEEEKGMGPARRQAIRIATELAGSDGAVCFIEPEKGPLVKHLDKCFEAVFSGADIVVPCRSPKSWESYPRLQRLNEPFGSYSFEIATGRGDLDMFFGPRLFNAVSADLFLKRRPGVHGGDSWGTTHYPVIEAIHLGYKVVGVLVDYIHPPEQTAFEDNPSFYIKRLDQIAQLAAGTFLYAMKLGLMEKDPDLLARFEKEFGAAK